MKNYKCYDGKLSKERVTRLLAANMDGSEKRKIVLIGKNVQPRCFKGVKWLPVVYYNNKKAWMTGEIFETWLMKVGGKFTKKKEKFYFYQITVLLTLEFKANLKQLNCSFSRLNVTSKMQSLDQGIIKSFKDHYNR
ncbi:tigger transposable element-derived protein 4-like [Euwallacea similis]|uniref:tigger transposable element-derived protein 4-like n=1 Tax=Euwallacea similis TaxID=1736056 RepID=UPI00344DBC39